MNARPLHWCALDACTVLAVSACSTDDAQPATTLLQAFRVERVMKGASDVAVGSEVSLVLHDNDKLPSNDNVRLEPGSRALLFLLRASGPANGRQVTVLLPVSGSNGIFLDSNTALSGEAADPLRRSRTISSDRWRAETHHATRWH
jgi:hypothetical protein